MARKMLVLMAALLPVAGGAAELLPRDGDALGRLSTAKLPGETVNYAYNVRNALTSITSPRFSQQLRYAAGAANPCYNGNIAEAITQGNKYAYTYDNANRLTAAKYTDAGAGPRYVPNYSTTYAYDRNSNITALTRYGQTGITTWGKIDDLTMTYDGNHLSKVEDAAAEVLLETSRDIKVSVSAIQPSDSELPPFRYDSNGNTTRDHTRNIYGIRYNALNLPQSIVVSSSTAPLLPLMGNSSVEHAYDAAGIKHQTVHVSWTKIPTSFGRLLHIEKRDTTRYVGSRIYENGQLDRVLTPYGYIKDGVHHTFLHDYQGNVAAVVAGDSLVQRTSYYPYGLPHANAHGATANPYKYGGKEFDTFGGTDLYDFHARYHAPSTGRFMTVDPHSETYGGHSTYVYCFGNPINVIDPTGMDGDFIDKAKELWDKSNMSIRSEGALQATFGGMEMFVGGGASLTGVGSVVGIPAILHGADQASTGIQKMVTGQDKSSLTSMGLQAAGMSKGTADMIDSSIGGVLSVGSSIKALAKTSIPSFKNAVSPAKTKIGATGDIGENELKKLGGEPQQYFRTPMGGRRVDQLVNGVAHESKVGYTTLTKQIGLQIEKDAYLVNNEDITGVLWHFYRSPVTGKIGPSKPLINKLNEFKIPYKIE